VGIIDSLSAGYRFLGRRIELLIVPIVLDLLLWLGPRLSVAPLFGRFAEFYRDLAGSDGLPSDFSDMGTQVAELLSTLGESSNLLTNLAPSAMLHMPSLVGTVNGLAQGGAAEIDNILIAVPLFILVGALGLLLGVFYLNQLVAVLPIGSGPKADAPPRILDNVVRQWRTVILYIVLLFAAILAVTVPAGVLMGVVTLVSPGLASLLALMLSAMAMVVSIYLYCVTAAIVVDDLPALRAVRQSWSVVRSNFWPTLGFILVYNLIAVGFTLIISGLAGASAVGMLVAIPVNAYIGSGLTLALLVFYRTRIVKQEELARFAGVS
jgi:hypothetical protein